MSRSNSFFWLAYDVPGGSDGKASAYNMRDLGLIPGLGRFPGEGIGNPLQYSCLENPMDGGALCKLLSMGLQRVRQDWATSLSLSFFDLHIGFSRGRSGGLVFPSLEEFSTVFVIHTVKGFGIVNKAEIDVFLLLFHDPADVGNLISGFYDFYKTSLNFWKFTVHVLLKPGLENFENYFPSVWDECNCVVVWAFFDIAFLWDWNEKWTLSSPVATAEFSKFVGILSAALSQHLPYDPAIPLLGLHTEEFRIERDTCTPMFITALFIIARTWKQPRCPSADEWIRKLWYVYTVKAFRLQMVVQAPMSATASSNDYLGLLDQRPSIWKLE